MKVSVVTISYNQGRFLEEAICSVLNQDHDDVEYIVVDPGSTDGSRAIIDKYRPQIDTVILEPDKGPADGLNKGFSRASGDIFVLINADDWLYPRCLSRLAQAFEEHPQWDVVCGHADVVDENGRFRRRLYSDKFSPRRFVYRACTVVGQAAFFRASMFRRVGGYNVDNRVAWDGELWIAMAECGATFGVIDEVLGAFRVYPGTITSELHRKGEGFSQYRADMFRRVVGRKWRWADTLVQLAYRIHRYSREPRSLYERIVHGPLV